MIQRILGDCVSSAEASVVESNTAMTVNVLYRVLSLFNEVLLFIANLYYSLLLSCIKLKVLKGGAATTIRLKGMKR
jgi:hypothetical protein